MIGMTTTVIYSKESSINQYKHGLWIKVKCTDVERWDVFMGVNKKNPLLSRCDLKFV